MHTKISRRDALASAIATVTAVVSPAQAEKLKADAQQDAAGLLVVLEHDGTGPTDVVALEGVANAIQAWLEGKDKVTVVSLPRGITCKLYSKSTTVSELKRLKVIQTKTE